jgi:hypothetical protein
VDAGDVSADLLLLCGLVSTLPPQAATMRITAPANPDTTHRLVNFRIAYPSTLPSIGLPRRFKFNSES